MPQAAERKGGPHEVIALFREIDVPSPADVIIGQIRELISSGVLKPGDRLPAERALAERFGVGRGHIREAIRRLEFYGILKTLPQSGTIVASLGVKALEGLIANVLDLDRKDIESLMETRALLEIQAARLAAQRIPDAEIAELQRMHDEFLRQVESGEAGLEEDLLFHLKVAECSHNSVLRSLIGIITPDILTLLKEKDSCRNGRFRVARDEHAAIMDAIAARDPAAAAAAMERHMMRSMAQLERRENPEPRARTAGGQS